MIPSKLSIPCLLASILALVLFLDTRPALASQPTANCTYEQIVAATLTTSQALEVSDLSAESLEKQNAAAASADPCAPTVLAGPKYYVDCLTGNDTNAGTSPTTAWKTIAKANTAPLTPGSSLLLKRSCTWVGPLKAKWQGTAAQPIFISAYGSGALPKIQNSANQNVKITGSYQVIEYIETYTAPANRDPNCQNQPVGWIIGFNFIDGSYNTLRYSKASGHTAGVRANYGAHHNKIFSNTLTNNNVMQILDKDLTNPDLGAWGMIINGDDNEIAYNYLARNNAICSYDFPVVGNAIELYAARRNNIHHNKSFEDKVFSELGGSATRKADSNIYAYNLHVSATPLSRFLVVRGSNDVWGPTWRTVAYNNTIYFTAPNSQGVVCGGGCSGNILTLKNNIIWAEEKTVYADAPFAESNNLYWNSKGTPYLQLRGFSAHPSSTIADPQFANPGAANFRLQVGSSAINQGSLESVLAGYTIDLGHTNVAQGHAVDIGAYEYR